MIYEFENIFSNYSINFIINGKRKGTLHQLEQEEIVMGAKNASQPQPQKVGPSKTKEIKNQIK
jgi:hypothetical protein